AGLLAVAMQSVALGAAIAVHWNGSAALLLAPPYLGFQLLAFFAAEGMERLEAARELQAENSRLEERLRISRELHDRLGHHLTALNLNLEVAARAENRQALEAARVVGKTLLQEVRAAVAELREPERLDVCGALRTLARGGLRRVLELGPGVAVAGGARGGVGALEVLGSVRSGVAVLDSRMPRRDGVGVLEALRSRPDATPCLVLSTFDDADAFLAA